MSEPGDYESLRNKSELHAALLDAEGRCLEEGERRALAEQELAALRERAEKAERERDELAKRNGCSECRRECASAIKRAKSADIAANAAILTRMTRTRERDAALATVERLTEKLNEAVRIAGTLRVAMNAEQLQERRDVVEAIKALASIPARNEPEET